MEDAKKARTIKARTTTRRINELIAAVNDELSTEEVNGKVSKLRDAMEELGLAHDGVLAEITNEDETAVKELEDWYYEYVKKANLAMHKATAYGSDKSSSHSSKEIKIEKLKLPKFDSSPKTYFKWKRTFERYLKDHDDEIKYDYLLTHVEGEAKEYVSNKSSYRDAIAKLDEKYGNKHHIMKLLLEDIRKLPIVALGNFSAFEKLSFQVNSFSDRLTEMGLKAEVENSYVLHEIESKLNNSDLEKWLESLQNDIDKRTVEQLVSWMDKQSQIRRVMNHTEKNARSFKPKPPQNWQIPNQRYVAQPSSQTERIQKCPMCDNSHDNLLQCDVFPRLDLNEKWNQVTTMRVCFICLAPGHRSFTCTAPKCSICGGAHNLSLHRQRNVYDTGDNNHTSTVLNYVTNGKAVVNTSTAKIPTRCFLPTARVCLQNLVGHSYYAKALLDNCSELHMMSRKCSNRLRLRGEPIVITIVGAGNVISKKKTEKVEVKVFDKDGSETMIDCIVMDQPCGTLVTMNNDILNLLPEEIAENQRLLRDDGEVDIIIGMCTTKFHKQKSMTDGPCGLAIIESPFGHLVVGPVPEKQEVGDKNHFRSFSIFIDNENVVEESMLDVLQAELTNSAHDCKCMGRNDDELKFEEMMNTNWEIVEGNRLKVKQPFKVDPKTLPNNREQALTRDRQFVKQLGKDKTVEELFNKQWNEMVDIGVIKEVHSSYPRRYLPLMAVVNLERESTKVRVCLDSKTKYRGQSLNDALLPGKLEMLDIMKAVTRFRTGKHALLGDISKMFWQILLDEGDQIYHGVVYKGRTFVFTRVCFGDKNSPPIADYAMRKIAIHGKESYPLGSHALLDKRYMDDVMDAHSNESVVIQEKLEIDELLGKFNFDIKAWYSNNPRVGKVIKDCKVLGLNWDALKDDLSIAINSRKYEKNNDVSKSNVLSGIAGVWDPMGLFAGLLVAARLIFQSIVRLKINWGERVIDDELKRKWAQWVEELRSCEGLVISRSLLPSKPLEHVSLVGFCDGSLVASGCVLYLRWTNADESEVEVKFVGAKGKVGPIKGSTVPRLELMGALQLARLTESGETGFEKTELKNKIESVRLFSDSSTALQWIRSEAIKYKPYVRNKIIKIQELVPVRVWDYIPGKKNKAADLISKGCRAKDLPTIIEGPEILHTPFHEWPSAPASEPCTDEDSEEEAIRNVNISVVEDPIPPWTFESNG